MTIDVNSTREKRWAWLKNHRYISPYEAALKMKERGFYSAKTAVRDIAISIENLRRKRGRPR